ncbi:glycosyltransferase family 2 protein [Microbacterium yannicii]|uniref:glycosyltransferase family 2 protein n=1 Tax=Microbacterium yannicii TaxID=671622 RepID=UPI0018876F41|nr:glycosyltransferase family 2 protein [Microbacterium yannicii]
MTNQDLDDYVVIVVGNKRPVFALPPRVYFVEVDFPAPAPPSGPQTDLNSFVWDKGTKIGAGLLRARDFTPDYVMIFDADDYVSRRIADHAALHDGQPGWVVERGWIYSHATGVYRAVGDFHRTCGTCHIVRWDAYEVPEGLAVSATQSEIADAFGDRLSRILGAHRNARTWLAEQGWQLEPLPFKGAVYNVDTGENHSGKGLSGLSWPASARFTHEFGVVPPRRMRDRVIAAVGPTAIAATARRVLGRIVRRPEIASAQQP